MTMIGQPIDRVDGPRKVTGQATYAYEYWEAGQPLYGFIVGATVGRGRITHIDTSRAERSPGVRMVMTHLNAPAQGTPDASTWSPYTRAQPALSSPDIHHYGEPVALVVAATFEQARAAASLVEVDYAAEPGQYDFAARQDRAYAPKRVKGLWETDTAVGDFDSAFNTAAVTVDQRYTTPYLFSQPMEPSTAVHRACEVLRETLRTSGGRIPPEGVEAEGEIVGMWDDPNYKAYSIHTYGAHFAEVGVDVDTAEIRLRRMLGVFAPGRVLNAKTARSQLIGGMTWGVSAALHEEAVVDTRSGAFVNRDLAEYLVPVHADIPELDAVLLGGFDDKANVLGVKGLGELGICGAGAAVANAVFNATGVRVRDFPITLDKILPGLPLVEV